MSALQLTTSRLRLRPVTVDDVGALWPYVTDPALPFHMTWEAHRDPSETRAFLEACEAAREAGTGWQWAITAPEWEEAQRAR
ncbi:MAG: GNAT family N-acetyltransferase [Polyangiales bacterium]